MESWAERYGLSDIQYSKFFNMVGFSVVRRYYKAICKK